jgi:hypothetical protein
MPEAAVGSPQDRSGNAVLDAHSLLWCVRTGAGVRDAGRKRGMSESGSRVPWKIGCQPTSTDEAVRPSPRHYPARQRAGLGQGLCDHAAGPNASQTPFHGSPSGRCNYAGRCRGSHLRVPYRPLPRRWISWQAPCRFPTLDLKRFQNPVHEKRGNASLTEPGSVFLFFLIYMKTKDCFPMGSTPSEAFPCFSDFSCTGCRETLP